MDDFERGVEKFIAFISADNEKDEAEAHFEWRVWAEYHPGIWADAQSEARRRWSLRNKEGAE